MGIIADLIGRDELHSRLEMAKLDLENAREQAEKGVNAAAWCHVLGNSETMRSAKNSAIARLHGMYEFRAKSAIDFLERLLSE